MNFAHKYNPKDQARSSKSMAWGEKGKGLQLSAKGEKEVAGGRMAN